eukprot:5385329-Amphidinium_carterae.2
MLDNNRKHAYTPSCLLTTSKRFLKSMPHARPEAQRESHDKYNMQIAQRSLYASSASMPKASGAGTAASTLALN